MVIDITSKSVLIASAVSIVVIYLGVYIGRLIYKSKHGDEA